MSRWVVSAGLCALLAACGGGGGGADAPAGPPTAAVTPASNLSIAVGALPASVPAGSTLQMSVTIANAGPGVARGVEVFADWGAGLEIDDNASCTSAGGAQCPGPDASSLADIPAGGSLQFGIGIRVPPTLRGAIGSTLATAAQNDADASNNETRPVLNVYQADVSVTAGAPAAPVRAGSATSYLMTVRNAGPDDARDVQIMSALAAGQSAGSVTCIAAGGAQCPASLGPAMSVPLLPASGSLAFTITANVASDTAGAIGETLTATAAGDPLPANNTASVAGTAFIAQRTGIVLQSDAGEFVGAGRNYAYDKASALLRFTDAGSRLDIVVAGDESWSGLFILPSALTQWQPGTYANLTRAPFRDPAVGGLEWSGEGRGCNTLTGSITVQNATYVSGVLTLLDFTFEQHCGDAGPALRGTVHWDAQDTTAPPPPVLPIPSQLWAPPAGATPASGNYVYLASEPGDFIGQGQTTTELAPNLTGTDPHLQVSVGGWFGDFQVMNTIARLQPGYYPNLRRYPFHNPARGGLAWAGNGRGCNTLQGWFAVDSVTYDGAGLAAIDLRFEQHCEGGVPALHGKLHWVR